MHFNISLVGRKNFLGFHAERCRSMVSVNSKIVISFGFSSLLPNFMLPMYLKLKISGAKI